MKIKLIMDYIIKSNLGWDTHIGPITIEPHTYIITQLMRLMANGHLIIMIKTQITFKTLNMVAIYFLRIIQTMVSLAIINFLIFKWHIKENVLSEIQTPWKN